MIIISSLFCLSQQNKTLNCSSATPRYSNECQWARMSIRAADIVRPCKVCGRQVVVTRLFFLYILLFYMLCACSLTLICSLWRVNWFHFFLQIILLFFRQRIVSRDGARLSTSSYVIFFINSIIEFFCNIQKYFRCIVQVVLFKWISGLKLSTLIRIEKNEFCQ